MKPSWMSDARQIPDEVMTFIRQIAVRAISEKKISSRRCERNAGNQ
jgi:hypothetical protein